MHDDCDQALFIMELTMLRHGISTVCQINILYEITDIISYACSL